MLSERVLTRWWRLVAFVKAMNLLHWVMRSVLYRHIMMATKTASKVGTFCINVLLIVTLAAARGMRSELSPDGSVQCLPVKPSGFGASLGGSKNL